ncbi:MAG: hypothetical protein WCY62_06010 [Clostridia bacterium]
MKTKSLKRSLCIALVTVMLLGLSVINASACSCSYEYWDELVITFEYIQLNAYEHDVMQTDTAHCRFCNDTWVACTHWYSENHSFVIYCLGYIDSIQMYEYERYCPLCGYGEIYYLPY